MRNHETRLKAVENLASLQGRITLDDPFMTAVTFAEHADLLAEICLNQLGKYAKRIAGDDYNTIPHPKFGKVGYLPICVWMEALYVYYVEKDMLMSVRQYCMFQDIAITREDRKAIEGVAGMHAIHLGLPVGVGETTKRYPEGQPLFSVKCIDEAMGIIASVKLAARTIEQFRRG